MESEIRVGRAPARHESDGESLLVVDDLRTHFEVAAGSVRAVDGVSFTLARGRTLGVVGESGSGKTVLSRSIMGLLPARGVVREGSIRFDGAEIGFQVGGVTIYAVQAVILSGSSTIVPAMARTARSMVMVGILGFEQGRHCARQHASHQ